MADPQADPAFDILKPLSVANPIKKAAWDVFQVTDQDTFEKRLKTLPLPNDAKRKLWDAKWAKPPTPSPTPAPKPSAKEAVSPAKPAKAASLTEEVHRAWDSVWGTTKTGAGKVETGAANLVSGKGGRIHAARDVVDGAMAATIIPATGLLAAGLTTAAAPEILASMFVGYSLAATTSMALSKFGASDDTASLVGDLAGFLTPGGETLGGKLRPGGARNVPEVAERIAANEKYGLKLSTPELATGTPGGGAAKQAQRAIASTLTGGAVQGAERRVGDRNALAALDQTVRRLARPGTRDEAGAAVDEGIKIAEAQRKVIGKQMGDAEKNAPPIDLQAPGKYRGQPVPAIKPEIERIFLDEILPFLKKSPMDAGKAQKMVEFLRDNPGNDTHTTTFGTTLSPQAKQVLKGIPETDATPIIKELKALYFGSDSWDFASLNTKRGQLRAAAQKGDRFFKGQKAGIAKHFESVLTQHMFGASPDFEAASNAFRATSDIVQRGVRPLLDQIRGDMKNGGTPSTAVDYLDKTPETARAFRQALLGVAAKGPDAGKAKAAYNLVRATYWQEKIVNGPDGKPDLMGMYDRLEKKRPTLTEIYKDTDGQKLLTTGEEIAKAFHVRAPDMQRSMYLIFTVARVLSGAGLGSMAITEASSGLITWLMYNPTMGRLFLNGSKAPTGAGYTALARVGQAYAAQQAVQARARQHVKDQTAKPESATP